MTDRRAAGPVYATDRGRLCPDCGEAVEQCRCASGKSVAAGDGIARVRRERKGRGGKTVTTVSGLGLEPAALKSLAARLKRRCGGGGTVRAGTIEIQGDHVETLLAELERAGYRAKQSGG